MLLVGVTGGLGAGKSTVARLLEDRGAVVVDADDLAREALEPGTPGYEQVCDLFGQDILDEEGRIDRGELAARVFADEGRRRALESITHPQVFRMLAETLEQYRETDAVVVFDAPLIVETGFQEAVDLLVVVTAPEDVQVERVRRDRGMSEAEARSRIAAQADAASRISAADRVLTNGADLAALERQVDGLWKELRARAEA